MTGNIQNFFGAYIRHVDLRKNGSICRIDLSADFTTALAKELDCESLRDVEAIERAALNLEPIPIQELEMVFSGMERQPLKANADQMKDFRLIRLVEPDGLIVRELRFHITVPGDNVALVHDYWSRVGEGRGLLTVRKLTEQTKITMPAAADGDAWDEPEGEKRKRGRPRKVAPFGKPRVEEEAEPVAG